MSHTTPPSRNPYGVNPADQSSSLNMLRYPKDHEAWVERYNWLADAYHQEPYDTGDIKGLHLFRALDEEGKEIAIAQRIIQYGQFIVDTDARALSGGKGLSLGTGIDGDAEILAAGDALWKRSKVKAQSEAWSLKCAMLGDFFAEPVRMKDASAKDGWRSHIVSYSPEHVRVDYHPAYKGLLIRAVIQLNYFDPPEVNETGEYTNGAMHIYQRVLTPTHIHITLDGVVQPGSGPHYLGVVPFVHVPFTPSRDPEHGLSAAHGVWRAVALCDSIIAQSQAVGIRYADPHIVIKGAGLADGSEMHQHGRYYANVPVDGSVEYLESGLGGLTTILQILERLRDMIREAPEFIFAETGANASGTAMSFRATAFESKMDPPRARYFEALALATQYAWHIDRVEAYDSSLTLYKVTGSPVLPVNNASEVGMLLKVKTAGGLTDDDFIRHLQRLDIVGTDENPGDYVVRVLAGLKALLDGLGPGARDLLVEDGDLSTVDIALKQGVQQVGTDGLESTEDLEGPPPDEKGALNGAQVTAASSIMKDVVAGVFKKPVAIDMMVAFFNMDRAQAAGIINALEVDVKLLTPPPPPAKGVE